MGGRSGRSIQPTGSASPWRLASLARAWAGTSWGRHLETAGTSEYPIRLPSSSREATSRLPHNRQLVRAGDRPNAASPCQRPPFLLGSPRHPAAVAQLVRAPDCGSGGRWFESTQLYHSRINIISKDFDGGNLPRKVSLGRLWEDRNPRDGFGNCRFPLNPRPVP